MRNVLLVLIVAVLGSLNEVQAQETSIEDEMAEIKNVEASLRWKEGSVILGDGIAEFHSSSTGFRYLDARDASKVLRSWGNRKINDTLGMLFPVGVSPFEEAGWGVVISYEDSGHVSDDDASTIDYPKLLKTMQEEAEASKIQDPLRHKMDIVGWATPPRYDQKAHKLYWAKELRFNDSPQTTLNYGIRVLGRKGVLILNAVASMDQLNLVESQTPALLASVNFTPGNRYEDYQKGKDMLSEYGLAALIAGGAAAKVAAKVGLFNVLLGVLIAGKKIIAVGFVGLVAYIRSSLKKRKSSLPT